MAANPATVDRHLAQWRHNRGLLTELPVAYPDWFVTVAFYAALHLVDAVLAHDQVLRVQSHAGRNDVLLRTNRYQELRRAYLPLYDLSQRVRYLADPAAWIAMDQIDQQVIRRYLYPIERSAFRLLGRPRPTPDVAVPAVPSTSSPSAS